MKNTNQSQFPCFRQVINEIVDRLGKPFPLNDTDISEIKNQITTQINSSISQINNKFYLIVRINGDIIFSHNAEKYLNLDNGYRVEDFFECIGIKKGNKLMLQDFLLWARAAYILSEKILFDFDPKRLAYKIEFPLLFKDGTHYWVQQDSRPFELDSIGKLISHINCYTVMRRNTKAIAELLHAEFYYDELYNEEMSKALSNIRFVNHFFQPKSIQRDILYFFYNTPSSTVKECAEKLKYPLNTVKKYISDSQRKQGIIDMAKVSFPSIKILKLKDVVAYLDKIGWFN